jgi:hypothetical protein
MSELISKRWIQHPEAVWKPVIAGRVTAELGMIVGAAAIIPLVQAVAPERYDRLKQHLARQVVLPRVDWLEKHVFELPAFNLTGQKLKNIESKEEKAKVMADAIVDFCTVTLTGIASQVAVQSLADRLQGLPSLAKPDAKGVLTRSLQHTRQMLKPVVFDKVVNMGVVGLMQFGLPQTTNTITDLTATGLNKTLGIPPEATQFFIQWYVPNIAGMGASGVMLTRKYRDFMKQLNVQGHHVA